MWFEDGEGAWGAPALVLQVATLLEFLEVFLGVWRWGTHRSRQQNITVKEEKQLAKENGFDGLVFKFHDIFIIVIVITPFPPAPFQKQKWEHFQIKIPVPPAHHLCEVENFLYEFHEFH